MRETSEGTSSSLVPLVFRPLPKFQERFARRYRHEHSPEIPLTLPFSGIFAGFSACYSYSNHSQDHGQWQVWVCVCECVCLWVCMLCAVLCFFCSKIWGKWINMDNKTGSNHGHNVVRKCIKSRETLGKCQNMVSIFGTVWPPTDPKKVQNWPFSPTRCFYVSPGICRRFWPEVLTQTPKNAVFYPRS